LARPGLRSYDGDVIEPHDGTESRPGRTSAGGAAWIGLPVAGALLLAIRLHAFSLPLEPDECNYAYIGQRLLAGDRLYIDVWDHQLPGVYALFAAVMAAFGDTPLVFRLTAAGFSLVSLCLIFAILLRTAGVAPAALGAALFAIASSDPGTAGEGCNREVFMTTLILAAWLSALRAPRSLGWCLASGGALGLASILKPVVVVHWLLLAAWIVLCTGGAGQTGPGRNLEPHDPLSEPDGRARSRLLRLAIFAAAPIAIWLGTFAWFAATGRWSEFADAVFLANVSYTGTADSFFARFLRFFAPVRHPFVFASALPLWLAGAAAVVWLCAETVRTHSRDKALILILVLSSFVAVCLPGRFWPHYYYLMMAPLVLAGASLAVGLASWVACHLHAPAGRTASTILICAALPAALLITEYRHYLSQPPLGITIARYNTRDFWGRAQGLNVERVTAPDDTVFVFGNDASIYYYAHRRCASRYTMLTALADGMRGADHRRRTLLAELRAAPPRLIILVFDLEPWPEWKVFLGEYYGEPVGWDRHDRTGKPIMAVLARKDAPIPPVDWNWDRSQLAGP
jgi:hypothetical protein